MDKLILDKIQNLVWGRLILSSPVLSGNMKQNIRLNMSGNDREIIIEAPFYDLSHWRKTGAIVHNGANINGKTDYAYWVNELGGFSTHNESEGWVNRAILQAVKAVANEIGAEVIYEL